MWQSNRSRSTGWQRPAVPPVRSASHPGENTSEQPIGKCGSSGGPVRCSATTSGAVACSMRTALRLTALRCVIALLALFGEPVHVDGNGDEQMGARANRPGAAGELGDHPYVADVVPIPGALRIWPVQVRREQAGLIEC